MTQPVRAVRVVREHQAHLRRRVEVARVPAVMQAHRAVLPKLPLPMRECVFRKRRTPGFASGHAAAQPSASHCECDVFDTEGDSKP
jgi:hypothetical protein